MKKHIGRAIMLIFLYLFALSLSAGAEGEEEAIRDRCNTDSIYENLPDGIDRSEIDSLTGANSGSVFEQLGEKILNLLSLGLKENLKFFAGLCGILLIAAVLDAVRRTFCAEEVGKTFEMVFLLCLSLYCYTNLSSTLALASNAIRETNSFILATLPVSSAFFALGGRIGQAVVQNANLIFAVDLIDTLLARFLLPLTRVLFAFSLVGAFSDVPVKSLSKFLQKASKITCVSLFTLLCGILTFQSVLAGAGDSVAMRGVRFAAGNFIPVVGNLVGEASKTLAASLNLVRTQCGVACLLIVLLLILTPVFALLAKKIVLQLSCVLCGMLGEKEAEGFLREMGGVLDLVMAVAVSSGVYFLISITLFIKSAAVLG